MKPRAFLLFLPIFLGGCLFSANQPIVGPTGDVALFLSEGGEYALFPDAATLHVLRGGEFVPVPAAALSEAGGVLDWSADGGTILYSTLEEGDDFGEFVWTLCSVGASTDAAPAAVLRSDAPIADAAFGAAADVFVLRTREDSLGVLERLDPGTGSIAEIASDVLAFRVCADRETLVLIVGDSRAAPALARVVRLDARTSERAELASFVLNEQTLTAYSMLPHNFLWDVDPSGRYVALSVYDQVLVAPAFEDEVTALYLIDTQEGTSLRLARMGIAPSFSPDGASLAYLTSETGAESYVVVRDIATRATTRVPGSDGAAACSWLGSRVLALAFEAGDDLYRLVRVDLDTGETAVLVE